MAWTEYNANTWTSAELITDVRRRARLSDSDQDYTDTVILREATDCIWDMPARLEVNARRGRKTIETTRSVTSQAINTGGNSYALPPMASGDSISSLMWVDSAGGVSRLEIVSADQETEYLGGDNDTGEPRAYALLDREIRLYPIPNGISGTLRVLYARRHPALAPATVVRQVSSIASASGGDRTTFTLASAPSGSLVYAGSWVDIVGAQIPHRVNYPDAVVTAVSGADVTVDVPYDTMSVAIDTTRTNLYMQSSGISAFVMLPLEFRKSLSELVAAQIMRQKGDREGAADCELSAMRSMQEQADFLASRTRGTKPRIKNLYSFARSRLRGGWGS